MSRTGSASSRHPSPACRTRRAGSCASGCPAGHSPRTPLPPALFHHLGRAVSDTELGEPLWPVLVAALAMEDPACASSAAFALADRYGATGNSQARDGVLRALRNAATASHAAIALACLALGWPSDPATQEMVTWGRRQQALPVRVTALGAVLGVLRRALTTAGAPECPLPGAQPVSEDERSWLVSLLRSHDEHASMWRPLSAHALATVLRDDPAAWEKARDDGLEILDKNNRDTFGDRGLAWAVLLLCRPEDPAVLGFVCDIIRTDPHYVHFLGHTLLPAAYPGHPSVAQAIEDSLRANPHSYMDSELHALAGIDHGPAMKDALLQSLTSGSFPHWAASALAARWEDDEESASRAPRGPGRRTGPGVLRRSRSRAGPRPRGSSGAAARPAGLAPQRPAAGPGRHHRHRAGRHLPQRSRDPGGGRGAGCCRLPGTTAPSGRRVRGDGRGRDHRGHGSNPGSPRPRPVHACQAPDTAGHARCRVCA